jgi:hypothetical protein
VLGPVVRSGDDFVGKLRDRQSDRAYALASPALQREIADAAGIERSIGTYQPVQWGWSQRSLHNGAGRLEGSVTYRGGRSGHAQLLMKQVDGQWRMDGYSLE